MGVVYLSGRGPVLRRVEGRVCHEDDRLVRGGGVAGHGHDVICHLVHVNLERVERIEGEMERGGIKTEGVREVGAEWEEVIDSMTTEE